MRLLNGLSGLVLAAVTWSAPGVAMADYPEGMITMVVPFTPGGPTDVMARAVARGMEEPLGVKIIVENKPGAGGNIGTMQVVRAEPDGYTILLGTSGPMSINPTLYSNAGYDPRKDLTPLAMVGTIPNIVVVNPAIGVTDLEGFAEYVRGQEGASYGSSGAGSTNHISGFLLNEKIGGGMMHVPYPGIAQAVNDLLGGHISVVVLDVLTALPYVKSGTLTALALNAPERSPLMPDVPTFAEQGIEYENTGPAVGVLGPAGLPEEVADKLTAAILASLESPEVSDVMANQGVIPSTITSRAAFAEFVSSELDRWGNIVRSVGVTLD